MIALSVVGLLDYQVFIRLSRVYQIIRRSGEEEKYLCVVRKRPGHFCDTAYIVVSLVAWEGVFRQQADDLYTYLVSTLTKNGYETERRCGMNDRSF